MKRRLFMLIAMTAVLVMGLLACADRPGKQCGDDSQIPVEYVVSDSVAQPQFSHETGSYDEAFTLTVESGKGTTVRYTLDGTEPTARSEVFPAEGLTVKDRSGQKNVLASLDASLFTAESSHKPGKVNKGTVIRAAAFDENGLRSETVTETYLVGLYYKNIKRVSLVMNSEDLFDYDTGIYVFGRAYDEWIASDADAKYAETWELEGNFSQKGREWERPVTVQIIEEDGTFGFEQDMGIRIMGTATRRYYQKSFRLTAREDYGDNYFEYDLIDDLVTDGSGEPLNKYKSFVLRNGGNDYGYTQIRDAFIQSRLTGRDFATQATEPAIVFINGEYWGLYVITEDYSDNYIKQNFGVRKSDVLMIKNGSLEEGSEEDAALYDQLVEGIYAADFTNQADYEWLHSVVDMQSLLDYMAVQIYINNEDGPFQGNNWRIWRVTETDEDNEYADGRWRFMLYDTEFSTGLYNEGKGYRDNTLSGAMEGEELCSILLRKLMENESFRNQLINAIMDLRSAAFEPNAAIEALTRMKLLYEPYAKEQYERNGPDWVIKYSDLNARYTLEVNNIRRFINGRYKYIPEMLAETCGMGDYFTLDVRVNDASGGTVRVNSFTPELTDGKWSGQYFAACPVTLTAQPAPGYSFEGWSGAVDSQETAVEISVSGYTDVQAIFKKN